MNTLPVSALSPFHSLKDRIKVYFVSESCHKVLDEVVVVIDGRLNSVRNNGVVYIQKQDGGTVR